LISETDVIITGNSVILLPRALRLMEGILYSYIMYKLSDIKGLRGQKKKTNIAKCLFLLSVRNNHIKILCN